MRRLVFSRARPQRRRCRLQTRRQYLDMGFPDDEGRREQHVVAAQAVDRAAHRIAISPRPCPRASPARGASPGSNGALVARSAHELDAHEQAAAADVADVRMVVEALAAARSPARARARARSRAGRRARSPAAPRAPRRRRRVAEVGVAVLEEAAAAAHRVDDPARAPAPRRSAGSRRPGPWRSRAGRARRLPARMRAACRSGPCRTSLRRGSAARRGDRRFPDCAGNSRARRHARRGSRPPPSRRRRRSRGRRRTPRSSSPVRRPAGPVGLRRLVGPPVAIGVARRDVLNVDQQRLEQLGAADRCRRRRGRPACCRDSSAGAR